MLVKNVKGSGERPCGCGSWLMHWERFAGVRAVRCGVLHCAGSAHVGAHVVKDGEADKDQYIVPMCQFHYSQSGVSLPLASDVVMIQANVAKTCAPEKI